MKAKTSTLLLTALLAACAGISPESLKPVAEGQSIELKTVQYQESYKLTDNRATYTIDGGRYVAKLQDPSGLFFEGPGKCFTVQIQPNGQAPLPAHSYRCGVYVPHNASAEPKLYFYRDPAVSAAIFDGAKVEVLNEKGLPATSPRASVGGALGLGVVRAFDEAELKNLHFFQEQPKPGLIRRAIQ
jgi:hypothetical protein